MALDIDPDLAPLDDALAAAGRAGYLLDAGGDDADQRYLSGFDAPDPFVSLYVGDADGFDVGPPGLSGPDAAAPGTVHLLVSSLEYGRAVAESRADEVSRLADYGWSDRLAVHGRREARARVIASFLADRGVDSVATPERFPLATADDLRDRGVAVGAIDDAVEAVRARKAAPEVEAIRRAQVANEAAISRAEGLLRRAAVEDGVLHRHGEPLTSEAVKEAIETELLSHGCALDETIVACGADAADPHDRGSGPLRADEPIIVDVFPREKATGYHADTTRTFVRGTPSGTVGEWIRVVDEARRAALDAVAPGVTGETVHDAACDVIEAAGHPTLRSAPETGTGFVHSTGHGVGLEVHERPRVAPGGEELEPGNVITIEPGLYDPAVGGVRIEDLVVVRDADPGYENLTSYPVEPVL